MLPTRGAARDDSAAIAAAVTAVADDELGDADADTDADADADAGATPTPTLAVESPVLNRFCRLAAALAAGAPSRPRAAEGRR